MEAKGFTMVAWCHTENMINTPKTELSRLIGEKWFLGVDELSEQSKIPKRWITQVLHGDKISEKIEKRLRAFLEKL